MLIDEVKFRLSRYLWREKSDLALILSIAELCTVLFTILSQRWCHSR